MVPASDFDYKKYLGLVTKKKSLFVTIALALITVAVAVSYILPPKYEAKATVFIEKSVISDLVKGPAATSSIEEKLRVLNYAIKSRPLLLKVFEDLGLTRTRNAQVESMVKDFQDRTDVKLKDKEGMFVISFNDQNPSLARDYVNTLVRCYVEQNISSKREESNGANLFLSEQIKSVKEKLEKVEAAASSFKTANVGALAENEQNIMHDISQAQQKVDEITLKQNELEAVLHTTKGNNPLQGKLAELQKRLQELNVVYTENYPAVIDVKNEIASTKEEIRNSPVVTELPLHLEKVRVELRGLRENERSLKSFIGSKRALLRSIPSSKASLEDLEREKESHKKLYEKLMALYGQAEVSKQMEIQDKSASFRVVDPAVIPLKPVSPNRVRIILIGIFAGIAGSFGILLLLDQLDNSIRDLDTLKSVGVPVLAVVPKITTSAALQLARKKDMTFFIAAGAYFSVILAILSFECMGGYSGDNVAQIRENLSQLTHRTVQPR